MTQISCTIRSRNQYTTQMNLMRGLIKIMDEKVVKNEFITMGFEDKY